MGILMLKVRLVVIVPILLGHIIWYRANKLNALLREMTDEVFDYLNKKRTFAYDAIKRTGDLSLFNQFKKDRETLYSELNKIVDSFTFIVWSFRPISRKALCGSILKIIYN